MLNWFRALMPKEDQFFRLFEQHASLLVAGADALRRALDGGPDFERHVSTVMDRENDADEVTRQVLDAVRRSFITPFDRGDIKDLITSMDDAIDQMRKTVKTAVLFDLRDFEPEMRDMADCIRRGAGIVEEVMPMLRSVGAHVAQITELSARMSEIEGETDDHFDAARRRLFQRDAEQPLQFWAANEILDHLESVMDRLEDVAHEVHSIVIEHV
jgi:uncharacterized protein